MRERGVSVFYGAFDEFKTTLVLDIAAHVAMGVPWQGRTVNPRPVIWYALEGKEEIPLRLRALEAGFKGKNSAWGDYLVPVTVRDRIPEDYADWRAEIARTMKQWGKLRDARPHLDQMPRETGEEVRKDGTKRTYNYERYPHSFDGDDEGAPPVIVIDTLSLALGGEDEKGPKAVGFINHCLDLLKERSDMGNPYDWETDADRHDEWYRENPEIADINYPVAAHVIIIHHQWS